jgi:hypothetical protein
MGNRGACFGYLKFIFIYLLNSVLTAKARSVRGGAGKGRGGEWRRGRAGERESGRVSQLSCQNSEPILLLFLLCSKSQFLFPLASNSFSLSTEINLAV